MCAEVRKMSSRFWELHSRDAIIVIGMIITLAIAVLSPGAGAIVAYIWFVGLMLAFWDENFPPFKWLKSNVLKGLLVVFAPLTCAGILIGCTVAIVGAPYFFWKSIQKDVAERRKQIEEGSTYVELDEPHLRNWLIGVPIYYLCMAGFLFGMWAFYKSNK